jgi:hypothetical protein
MKRKVVKISEKIINTWPWLSVIYHSSTFRSKLEKPRLISGLQTIDLENGKKSENLKIMLSLGFINHNSYEGTWSVEKKNHIFSNPALEFSVSYPFYYLGNPLLVGDK